MMDTICIKPYRNAYLIDEACVYEATILASTSVQS